MQIEMVGLDIGDEDEVRRSRHSTPKASRTFPGRLPMKP